MDHRELIRSLSAEQRRELTTRSNLAGLKALSVHWGAIGIVAWLIAERVVFWQLLLPIQGILIVFLFTLMHEAIHRTPFASNAINDAVANVCGLFLALPATWFREFHMAHHRHTQDEYKDPELQSAKPDTPMQYFVHISGIPVWTSQIRTLLRNASGRCEDSYVSASKLSDVKFEARWMLCVYASFALVSMITESALLLFIWLIPAILGQPFLRLYLLAEHGRCAFVTNAFENSRTTFTSKLVRALAWNMPFHAEHHAYPMVPFFRLGEFHRLVKSHLTVTENGYVAFNKQYFTDLERDASVK